VAALERAGTELTTLLAAADSALYRAKQDGRNKTCLASDSPLAQIIPAARPALLTGPSPALLTPGATDRISASLTASVHH